MESASCWLHLWMLAVLFTNTSAGPASPPRYTVRRTRVSFDRATQDCSPGALTTLATDQEVADILGLVTESASPLNQKEVTFWVGLRKVKDQCVDPTLPLRGFKWTADGGKESQVTRWAEEPKQTCTTVRCAALKVEFDGSTVIRWGLIAVTCKNSYQFICKLRETAGKPATPEPEPEPATPEPLKPEPATPEPPKPEPATPEPPKPEPRPATQKPDPAAPGPAGPTGGPEPDLTSETGPELQGPDPHPVSEPASGSDSCERPRIPGSRSFRLDPDNRTRIQVECWSGVTLELRCSGRPAMWRLADDSPANFSTVCHACEDGFQKDASGNCVDINECDGGGGGATCRHTCLNTAGSYRCVCFEDGKVHDERSPACTDTPTDGDGGWLSGILIPVLVGVAALVVLVVVVAVTVKCCLMRRSKRRAMKKAEKMAMKSKDGKDSFETANEKVAS